MTEVDTAVRAALFIDFDNVFLSLNQIDRRAGKTFAERPALWLDWLEAGRHAALVDSETDPRPRRILVRNCYLNPSAFGNQRAFFTRAAFDVVDCPALTARGKNSADIVMAMDILDAIQHPTRFDEFIILSSDADFTPVLLRLRAFDRLTSVLTSVVTAAAFREACDISIDLETFAVEALGLSLEDRKQRNGVASGPISDGQPPASAYSAVRPRAANILLEEVRRNDAIPSQDVFRVFTRLDKFQDSYWFGMGTLKALLDELTRLEPEIFVEMDGSLPAAVRLRKPDDPPPPESEIEPADQAPSFDATAAARDAAEDQARFVDDVYVLIGAPKLSTDVYGRLFRMLAQLAANGVATPDELLAATASPPPRGAGVSRRDASYVISSLVDSGGLAGAPSPAELAQRFCESLRTALANAGRGLDADGMSLLRSWLIGGLEQNPGERQQKPSHPNPVHQGGEGA